MNRAFEVILLLNLTGLFSFIAIEIGIPIAMMSAAILAFLLLFLVLHYRRLWWFLQKKDVLFWAIFVFVWPALTVIYADSADVRSNALNLYLVALMLCTAIWLSKVGLRGARWVLISSAAITLFGLILSLVRNDYFQAVASAADARYAYVGRAFGFFLQPNMAAENMCFLYALLLPVASHYGTKAQYLVSGTLVLLILLTGSRGGMITAAVLVIYVHILSADPTGHRPVRSLAGKLGAIVVIMVALFSANEIAKMTSGNADVSAGAETSLTSRIGAMSSFDLEAGGLGATAAARYIAALEHWNGIVQRPFRGFGIGASLHHASTGRLTFSAHNQYIQIAYDFGLLALTLFFYMLFRLWRSTRKVDYGRFYGCNPVMVLFLSLAIACLFSTAVMYSRVLFSVLGALFALRYAREQVTGRADE